MRSFILMSFLVQNQFAALNLPKKDDSQIEGPSIANTYGFKVSMQNLQDAKALHEVCCTSIIYRTIQFVQISVLLHLYSIGYHHFTERGV